MTSQKALHFVVEERRQQDHGMEGRVQHRTKAMLAFRKFFRNLGADPSEKGCEKGKYDKRFADPQKVEADRVENIPVRFTDEWESVRIVAEQKQKTQKNVRCPECEGNKD